MSNVVSFAPRTPDGDWTSGERARLAELAERLMAGGARVQLAYGLSDEGDPWCVIQDDQDEVLIHVARIGGKFVIHDAAADAVRRTDTLWGALKRLLGMTEGAVVDLRKAQALLALVMAVLFVEEAIREERVTVDLPDLSPNPGPESLHAPAHPDLDHLAGAPLATSEPPTPFSPVPLEARIAQPPPAHDLDAAPPLRTAGSLTGVAATTAGARQAAAAPVAGPVSAPPSAPPSPAPHIEDAPRVLAQASTPERFTMAEGVVARGTAGQDTFVIAARPASTPSFGMAAATSPSASAGVILDFAAGDKLVFGSGVAASIVSVSAVSNVLAELPGLTAQTKLTASPGVRVGVDVNGDGVEDAYVMVAGPGVSTLTADAHGPHGAPDLPSQAHGEAPLTLAAPLTSDFLLA